MITNSFCKCSTAFARSAAVALAWALQFHQLPVEASNATLTIVTNPPQGGSVTGAGIYTTGALASVQIQASNGWYVQDVSLGSAAATAFAREKVAYLLGLPPGGIADFTLITTDSESITMSSDTNLTVTFGIAAPTFNEEPVGETILAGSTLTLNGSASGRQPISYQWQFDSTNIAGATLAALVLSDVQLTNSGRYTLVASNACGVTTSQVAVVTVQEIEVFVNGSSVNYSPFTSYIPITVALESLFPNGDIFYTLDGSTPDFTANYYSGPFEVTNSCTLQVIAYSEDFFQTAFISPFRIQILPSFSIWDATPGGGYVALDPSYGPYPSNSTVTVTAVPYYGWRFMGWSGASRGTNASYTITVTNDITVQAVFGTPLATTVAGNGGLTVFPLFPIYPYGTVVQVTAVPQPGNYFGLWGNAASGNANPLSFGIYNGTPTVSSLFASLPANQFSLTVLSQGGGSVLADPATNRAPLGATIQLTAQPVQGQSFLGWSGGASGTANPLSLVMNASKSVTAHFSRTSSLAIAAANGTVNFSVSGPAGDAYRIDNSTDLINWTPFVTVTNYFGSAAFTDSIAPNLPLKVYRAVVP